MTPLDVGWLVEGGLVAARLGGAIMVLPVFGTRGVPVLARVAMALVLAVVVTPVVATGEAPQSLGLLIGGMTGEVLVGVILGGVVRLVFGALHLASELVATQIGHGAAMMFDPMLQASQGPVGTLSGLLAGLIFLGTDMHLELILALGQSFVVVPPGQAVQPWLGGMIWVETAGLVIAAGVRLAGPVIALVFLINLFAAVVTRLAPSMNVFFSLGLILTLVGGLFMWHVSLPHILVAHQALLEESLGAIPGLLQRLAPG